MTNSAIPNPKVPNAKASKPFFITTVFRYRRSPTERSLSRCDRKRFVRATATVPPERRPGVRFADREARKYRKPDIEIEQTSRFSLYAENGLRRIMFYFRKKQTRCVGFFGRYVCFSSYITESSLIVMQAIRLLAVLGIVLLKFSDYGSHSTQQRTDNFG